MSDIKVHDRVIFDGKEAVCISKFAGGLHYNYTFDDGRTFVGKVEDLISQGRLTIIPAKMLEPQDDRKFKQFKGKGFIESQE